ncbi:MAG: DUF4349 domain-containing protein [Nanoarchaeota archaeon]|nr:DUF4349 domain-containing protein [Nanoarchaeota archaeon]
MKIKEQFKKIKDNWLIAVLIIVLFLFISGGNILQSISYKSLGGIDQQDMIYAEKAYSAGIREYYPESTGDFAPEIEERIKIKTTNLAVEVERETFHDEASKLKSIIKSSDSYLLNENVNKYGTKRKAYYSGSYTIKIDTEKYDSIISQLKNIGELKSFSENERDVTGTYTNLEIDLEIEKERLERYEEMYEQASKVDDKINLNDRIFNQQRRIKYLEDSIENIDKRVDYSTVYFSMTEKRSEYANVILVKFSELVRSIVNSFNNLIKLIFVLAPWAVALALIAIIFRVSRKHKKRK